MSDTEQLALADALDETLPPLQQAAQQAQDADQSCWQARLRSQEMKGRVRAMAEAKQAVLALMTEGVPPPPSLDAVVAKQRALGLR